MSLKVQFVNPSDEYQPRETDQKEEESLLF